MTDPVTTNEAVKLLGVKGRSTLHVLKRRYPKAFIIHTQGITRGQPTLYERAPLLAFVAWRNQGKGFKAVENESA